MNLNSYMIAARLQGVTETHLRSDCLKARLSFPVPFDGGRTMIPSCLYIATSADLQGWRISSDKGSFSIVSIGQPPEALVQDERFDVIVMRPQLDVQIVIQQVDNIFAFFNEWQQRLLDGLIESEESLDSFLALGVPVFNCPIELYGRRFQVLGTGQTKEHCLSDAFYDNATGFLSKELMQQLSHDEAFAKSHEIEGPCIGCTTLSTFCNIRYEEKFLARLVVVNTNRDCTKADLYPLGIFSKMVKQYLVINRVSIFGFQSPSKMALKKFLFSDVRAGSFSEESVIASVLDRLSWKRDDTYRCIYIFPDASAVVARALYYQCLDLEMNIQGSIALIHDGCIILVENISVNAGQSQELYAAIDDLSKKHLFLAGTSTEFGDFSKAPIFCSQARAAAETGKRKNGFIGVYRFEDVALDYVLSHGLYSIPSDAIIPRSLQKVIDYDAVHGSEYYETLKCLLRNNMNAVLAADLMSVHVGTLRYRIKRLSQMLEGIDLQDADCRLYLQCVIRLTDFKGGLSEKTTV